MSNTNTGGWAFPAPAGCGEDNGMTLRDYFAAKALPSVFAEAMAEAREGSGLFQYPEWREGLALDAYEMADAMLKARQS